jgi:hypothetical protein
MNDWLVTTLAIYRSSFVRGATVAAANWPVLGSVFAYAGLMFATALVAAFLGIVGGFLVGIVWAACIASFLYLVEMMVRTSRVSLADFQRSFGVYLWDVAGISFAFWIFWMFVGPVLESTQHGPAIVLSIDLLIFVLFNAVPELIYCGHHSLFELLAESYQFIADNWIEWFPPNLLLAAGFWALLQIPGQGLLAIVRIAAIALFVYFAMVVRGFLFLELAGSSRRSRVFRYRSRV